MSDQEKNNIKGHVSSDGSEKENQRITAVEIGRDQLDQNPKADSTLDQSEESSSNRKSSERGILSDTTKIFIGFVITLFFSILGFFLSFYINLPNPRVDIVEIGLSGSNSGGRIEVDTSTVTLSERTVGIESLSRFESFEKLLKIEKSASEEIAKIDNALASIENWYKSYTVINNSNLLDHPLRNQFVSNHFVAAVRSQFVDIFDIFPNDIIDNLKNSPEKLPFLVGNDKGNNVFLLSFGDSSWRLSFHPELDQEHLIRGITGLAFSVATHDFVLLERVSDVTRNWLQKQKNNIIDVRNDIRKLILPSSTFSVSVVVSNTGGTAFVVRPYMMMDILNSDLDGSGILLEPRIVAEDSNPFRLTEGGFSIDINPEESNGTEVLVEDFLPNGKSSSYTIVAPGSSSSIELVGVRVLGDDAEKFLGLMRGEALSVMLSAMSVENKKISSAEFTFRTSLRDSVIKQIVEGYEN